jgi:hypothetical protein
MWHWKKQQQQQLQSTPRNCAVATDFPSMTGLRHWKAAAAAYAAAHSNVSRKQQQQQQQQQQQHKQRTGCRTHGVSNIMCGLLHMQLGFCWYLGVKCEHCCAL